MATKSQEILLKGNTTNASAVPSSLKVREIAINALDRSLFTNDGNSIVKLYTGTTKWFDVNGNANNALKLGGVLASEYINKEAFNSHINNSIIHITADERTKWNNKWDYNEETIKAVKVNAAVNADKATKLATARKIWGKYFDGSGNVSGDLIDVGNITASGKATIQGDIISGGEVVAIAGEGTPAGVTDYSALTGKPAINGVTLVSGNNTLASLGIQAAGDYATISGVTNLLANYADKTFVSNNYVGKTAFNNHTADTDIHITAAERVAWNAKWNYDEATIKAVKVTSASSADKLNSNAGTSAIPIYFKNGKPTQRIPSDLFSGLGNAYASTETSLGITIAGHTRMVVVAYSQTAGSVAWTGITDKPSTFTPSAHTHTASEVSGLPTSLKNPFALTFGSKTYDGSAAATITASDLGALTAHQSIYAFTLQVNGTSKGTYNPTSAAKTINIAVPTKTSQITNDSGFITGITKSMVEGVLTGNITSHTHSQYLTSALRPATLTTDDSHSNGYYKIRITNQVSSWMLSFDVKMVHYSSYTIRFNGSNYNMSESWFNPSASMIDGEDSIEVKFGYDTTPYLWVAIPASSRMGISITNVANGFIPIDTYALDKLFTITYESELSGTTQQTITLYPPSKEGHTHTASEVTGLPTKLSAFTNDVGFITGITKSMVEGVLTGNITSHTHSYLPLSGGTITSANPPLYINRINGISSILYQVDGITVGILGFNGNGTLITRPEFQSNANYYDIIHSGNYNSYAPTLTGTGASGTWGIDISGNASSATKLQTPRTIWGQSFDGSANVSGNVIGAYFHIEDRASNPYFKLVDSNGQIGYLQLLPNNQGVAIGSTSTKSLTVNPSGNVLIGTTTDNGYKLQVNGSERVYGDLIVDGEVSALVA